MITFPIPYGKQEISQDDITAVVKTLQSDFLTQGPIGKEFEKTFAKYVGSKYSVAVANGTAALHLNALALDVKPGDKVITTPITFAATANCICYCGGEVVFSDIDPKTYLLDIKKVRELLEKDKENKIKGIIPVDFAGRSVDMEAFRNLADEFNCWIIEDACHAPGASFTNKNGDKIKAGSGKYSDLSIFSFHPVKHIATGEGGMITTNNQKLYNQLIQLRTHGITKNEKDFINPIELAIGGTRFQDSQTQNYPKWYMEMQSLGFNYRLSDINSALGLSQLKRAEKGLKKRRLIAKRYFEALQNLDQITDKNIEALDNNCEHAYHLYVIEAENRLGLYNWLKANQILCQVHYVPTHIMPYYQTKGYKSGDFPNAESYYSKCLSLPIYPSLDSEQQEFIIEKIIEFYK